MRYGNGEFFDVKIHSRAGDDAADVGDLGDDDESQEKPDWACVYVICYVVPVWS